jgi:hypothetical protein
MLNAALVFALPLLALLLGAAARKTRPSALNQAGAGLHTAGRSANNTVKTIASASSGGGTSAPRILGYDRLPLFSRERSHGNDKT